MVLILQNAAERWDLGN